MATVSEGRQNIAELLINGEDGVEYDSIAIGSDGSATTDGMTSIQVEVDSEEGLTGSASDEQATLQHTFENNDADIEEVSIYESTSGNMLARQTIDTVPLDSDDSLEITWEIDVNDGGA